MTLTELLASMDVPAARVTDMPWLARNLAVRNAAHPHFAAAMRLILQSLKTRG